MKLLLGLFGLALITAALAAPTRDSEEVAVEPEVEATTEKQTQRNIKEEIAQMLRDEGVPEAAIEDLLNLNVDWKYGRDSISREELDLIIAWSIKWNIKSIEDAKFKEKEEEEVGEKRLAAHITGSA